MSFTQKTDNLEQLWESKMNEMKDPKTGDYMRAPGGKKWVIKKGGKAGSARVSYDADGKTETVQRRNMKPVGDYKDKTLWDIGKQTEDE